MTSYPSTSILASTVEQTICRSITSIRKNSWDENHVTFTWLGAVVPLLSGVEVYEGGSRREVACRAYKAKGKQEQDHGDVAVLVSITHHDDPAVRGVGFLEAKRRDWSADKFPALKKSQLRRQYSKTRYAKVLFYDHEPMHVVTGVPQGSIHAPVAWSLGHPVEVLNPGSPMMRVPVTYAGVVPMDMVMDHLPHDHRVYRFAVPLRYQICFRYLQGQDLDLDAKVVTAATAAADRDDVATAVLAIGVRVGAGGGDPPELPQLPADTYEPVQGG